MPAAGRRHSAVDLELCWTREERTMSTRRIGFLSAVRRWCAACRAGHGRGRPPRLCLRLQCRPGVRGRGQARGRTPQSATSQGPAGGRRTGSDVCRAGPEPTAPRAGARAARASALASRSWRATSAGRRRRDTRLLTIRVRDEEPPSARSRSRTRSPRSSSASSPATNRPRPASQARRRPRIRFAWWSGSSSRPRRRSGSGLVPPSPWSSARSPPSSALSRPACLPKRSGRG